MSTALSAIILAGGYSSRMGTNKAELSVFGTSMLEYQVSKIKKLGITDIIISGENLTVDGTGTVKDVYPHKGPLSGIHAGLIAAKNNAALVLPVDTPLISLSFLEKMIGAYTKGTIVAEHNNTIEPLIGIYEKAVIPICEKLLISERTSMRRLLEEIAYIKISFDEDNEMFANINTPADYDKLVKKFDY